MTFEPICSAATLRLTPRRSNFPRSDRQGDAPLDPRLVERHVERLVVAHDEDGRAEPGERDRQHAGPDTPADCGFASFAATCEVHPSVVWVKFAALAEGARLASRELWRRAA